MSADSVAAPVAWLADDNAEQRLMLIAQRSCIRRIQTSESGFEDGDSNLAQQNLIATLKLYTAPNCSQILDCIESE